MFFRTKAQKPDSDEIPLAKVTPLPKNRQVPDVKPEPAIETEPAINPEPKDLPESDSAPKGFLKKLFGPRQKLSLADSEAGPVKLEEEAVTGGGEGVLSNLFPARNEIKPSPFESDGIRAADEIFEEVAQQAQAFNAPELDLSKVSNLPPVPKDFDAEWKDQIEVPIWGDANPIGYTTIDVSHPDDSKNLEGYGAVRYDIDRAYSMALSYSPQVRSYLRIPKVQEAIIRENRGLFDPEAFAQGDTGRTDEPTGSILTTGETGRFLQDSLEGEYGVRKRLGTGAEVKLSQRLSTLDNNSEFLDPNPQTGSEVVLSVAQPLLRGFGQDYVRSEIRLAELDRNVAEGESLRLLEDYLLEVNRTYWGVYLSRAALAQRKKLSAQTTEVVNLLEERQKLDDTATVSELYRAKAMANRREADLRRTEMAVKSAEQRLRSMIKDPALPMGASGELIPVSRPFLEMPSVDIQSVSREALANRAEMTQASSRVRSAAVRLSQMAVELKPQLDLVGEVGNAGIAGGRDLGGAIDDSNDHGTNWRVGLRYSIPWGNEVAKARFERRDLEYHQAIDDYRIMGESILLESLIAYQDLLTGYQDMAGKYQSVLASRKEIEQLRDRMDLDDQDVGKTIAYQLQLLLSAIDRNQVAEEEFLVSIVAYNTAIAQLQRAQGVLLEVRRD